MKAEKEILERVTRIEKLVVAIAKQVGATSPQPVAAGKKASGAGRRQRVRVSPLQQ